MSDLDDPGSNAFHKRDMLKDAPEPTNAAMEAGKELDGTWRQEMSRRERDNDRQLAWSTWDMAFCKHLAVR